MYHILLVIVLINLSLTNGHSTGAPLKSCLHLNPKHGSLAQPSSSSPYTIHANAFFDEETEMEIVEVTILSPNNSVPFMGFAVQARLADNTDIIVDGEFVPEDGEYSKAFMCQINDEMKFNVCLDSLGFLSLPLCLSLSVSLSLSASLFISLCLFFIPCHLLLCFRLSSNQK